MQHLTVSEKSVLVGDAVADAVIRYAVHLGRIGSADDVDVRAIGVDGEEVVMHLVLNSGTVLALESTRSTVPEPENATTVRYIADRLAEYDLTSADEPGRDPST